MQKERRRKRSEVTAGGAVWHASKVYLQICVGSKHSESTPVSSWDKTTKAAAEFPEVSPVV